VALQRHVAVWRKLQHSTATISIVARITEYTTHLSVEWNYHYCMYSFGYFPGVRLWFVDVSEPSVSFIFKGWVWSTHVLHAQPLCTPRPAFEDGNDRGFRNVGKSQSDAGEMPKRIHTIFKTRRKFEIIKLSHFPGVCLLAPGSSSTRTNP
jgi:hypothetical protein